MQRSQVQDNNQQQAKNRITSDQSLKWAAVGLSVVGLVVSSYLVYIKFDPGSLLCTGVGDCAAVNASRYSEIGPVPVAVLGVLAYLFLLVSLLLESRFAFIEEWGPAAQFMTALAGTLYSAYLTYIEVAVIEKICPYCVTSAVVITVILVITSFRLRRYF
jgi:uncharacterized membrane protein